jgi:hypothetical protein
LLFNNKLATATRNEMLRILRRKAKAFAKSGKRAPRRPVPQSCPGGRFLLRYEGRPGRAHCIDLNGREFRRNFVDYNIADFQAMVNRATGQVTSFRVIYKDGRTKSFTKAEMSRIPRYLGPTFPVDYFLKRRDGFIYHIHRSRATYSTHLAPEIVAAWASANKRARALKQLWDLGLLTVQFAKITGLRSGLSGIR